MVLEDAESQAENMTTKVENVDEFINDGDILEDESLEDYMDEQPLEEDVDETNEEENMNHIYSNNEEETLVIMFVYFM